MCYIIAMKRLFRIGSGLFIYSLVPILSWLALSYILGNSDIANTFSIVYCMQFVWAVFVSFFAIGANIRKEKTKAPNAVEGSMFWGIIFATIVFAIPLIFVNGYISFFGQNAEFYKVYVIYGILLLFLQTLLSFVVQKLYFEDREKTANLHLIIFNVINFAVLSIVALIFKNAVVSTVSTLVVLAAYVVVIYCCYVKKFKIDLKFYKNMKYQSAGIVNAVFMFIIYLVGYKIAFSAGAEYLMAINIVAMSTDTEWDVLGAIETVANVDISKGRYNYKKEVKNAYIFTFIMIAIAAGCCILLAHLNHVAITLALAFLAFQVADMLLDPLLTIWTTYCQIDYSATVATASSITAKVLRTLLSVLIISPFCTDIGQVAESVLLIVILLIVRFKKFKRVGNELHAVQTKKH